LYIFITIFRSRFWNWWRIRRRNPY